jgi:serine/threonine protein kinase
MTNYPNSAPDREERLQEVLLAYMEADPLGRAPGRQALLAAHPDLRQELEEFFTSHDAIERLAAPLRAAARDEPAPAAPEGEAGLGQLGDFRLLREVGRGGMGVVYEAEQISLRRRVALKVLPFATALDPRRLRRFQNEALAAANLRHENIVPVYAVGQERGVHYYAMQFIEGQSLAALIAELRRQKAARGSRPGPEPAGDRTRAVATTRPEFRGAVPGGVSDFGLGGADFPRWVAGLGRQAAVALEHAHQAGIVHRDVKPANLLLDARGQLWIADFGLAQVGDHAGVTRTGEMLGTLRYASPEQAGARRGLVDHRSDVYSLGATLYELLTLKPLFEGAGANELLRQIADEEPRRPRLVEPSIPVELETVVLKALGKEPADRYATAQELADDLQRFVENRPIRARRPTLAERLRKWARRHPSLVVAAVLVLALWSAGSFVATALVLNEQQKAEAAYRAERHRAEEAEERFKLAQRAVNEMIQVSEKELANRPGMEGVRSRLLKSALGYYQELIAQRGDDPVAQAGLRDTKEGVEKVLADLAALRGAGQRVLLSQPAVLDDLGLDAVQRLKIKELTARLQKQQMDAWHEFAKLAPGERGRRILKQARANEAAVAAILTAAQLRRLHEIALQMQGPTVFREPEVAMALKLSDEQRERIWAIEEETFLASMKKGGPAAGPPSERVLTVLTREQAGLWREITGEPFRGPPPPFFPFGGFAPPPDKAPPAR